MKVWLCTQSLQKLKDWHTVSKLAQPTFDTNLFTTSESHFRDVTLQPSATFPFVARFRHFGANLQNDFKLNKANLIVWFLTCIHTKHIFN